MTDEHIVSTCSIVLSVTEQRNTVCEQELLAVVYALQKFRIFFFGHHVTIYSDNKTLSFLKKCSLVSNRITRWVMEIQEYNLEIVHVKGTDTALADVLSRNPVGMTIEEVNRIGRPQEIAITKIDLNLDPQVKKDLRNLA